MSSDDLVGSTAPGSEGASRDAGSLAAISSLADLVRLRDSKGFSASLVSSRLRLAPRQIAALEAGDWASLPGRTFIRSSLLSYGRLLEADVAPLLAAIESELPGADVLKPDSGLKRPMPREGALGFGGSGSGSRWVWMLLLVVGVIALAFFYGGGATLLNRKLEAPVPTASSGDRSQQPVEAGAATGPAAAGPARSDVAPAATVPPPVAAAPAPAAIVPLQPAVPPSGPSAASGPSAQASSPQPGPSQPSSPLNTQNPAATSGQAAAQTPVAPAAPPGPTSVVVPRATGSGAGPGVPLNPLVMRFSADSWIEVRDGAGALLITGTQPPGTVRELTGELPFSLTIGNAGTVTVTWRGAPIDLVPHMRQGVARFRIE